MEFILVLIVSIAFSAICVVMARKRRRNEMLWGVLGLLFGPIPVVVLAILGTRT